EESRSGIPILKDIPVLGWLFGTTRKTVTNAELFLFLTPYVVANDQDEERLRRELEGNAELLQELVPIKSMLPPSIQALLPDSLPPDLVLPDTVRVDTMGVVRIRPDTMRIGGNRDG
ncbi:MAG: hypothetical protein MUO50_06000, partial [Longimicrobiales bacterium]|nr:hypothetical protein [Longimicrobiales bacterium]